MPIWPESPWPFLGSVQLVPYPVLDHHDVYRPPIREYLHQHGARGRKRAGVVPSRRDWDREQCG